MHYKLAIDRSVRWHIANWERKSGRKPPLAPLCRPAFPVNDKAVRAELERRGYRVVTSWSTRRYEIIGRIEPHGGANA